MRINPLDYLTGDDRENYLAYRSERKKAFVEGRSYWDRIRRARGDLWPIEPKFYAVWEDTASTGDGVQITRPSPWLLSMLVTGDICPPIEARLDTKYLLVSKAGESRVVDHLQLPHAKIEMGELKGECVIDYRRVHAETTGPMSLKDAHEYIFAFTVPHYAWGIKGNRPTFAIVDKGQIPTDRTNRDSWRMADFVETGDCKWAA